MLRAVQNRDKGAQQASVKTSLHFTHVTVSCTTMVSQCWRCCNVTDQPNSLYIAASCVIHCSATKANTSYWSSYGLHRRQQGLNRPSRTVWVIQKFKSMKFELTGFQCTRLVRVHTCSLNGKRCYICLIGTTFVGCMEIKQMHFSSVLALLCPLFFKRKKNDGTSWSKRGCVRNIGQSINLLPLLHAKTWE